MKFFSLLILILSQARNKRPKYVVIHLLLASSYKERIFLSPAACSQGAALPWVAAELPPSPALGGSEHSQRWEGHYRIKVLFFTWLKFYHKFKCLCRHHCYTGCTYLGSSIFIKIARSLNSISVFIVSLSNVSFCCKKVKVKECIFF